MRFFRSGLGLEPAKTAEHGNRKSADPPRHVQRKDKRARSKDTADFVALRGSERANPGRHSSATGATHSKARATRDRVHPAAARAGGRRASRDASVDGHPRRTTKTSAGVNRNKMDAQVELPGASVKTPPHRFDSFSGLRRSGSGAIVSGTEARSMLDRARPRRHRQFCPANARSKKRTACPSQHFHALRPAAGASATRVPAAASPGRPGFSRASFVLVHARDSRAAFAASTVRFSVLQRD